MTAMTKTAATTIPAQPGFWILRGYEAYAGGVATTRVPVIVWRIAGDQLQPVTICQETNQYFPETVAWTPQGPTVYAIALPDGQLFGGGAVIGAEAHFNSWASRQMETAWSAEHFGSKAFASGTDLIMRVMAGGASE